MEIEYKLIDMFKFGFACLIPLLHIPFSENMLVVFMRQYVSRMGVPFFFAVSGVMLVKSIRKRGKCSACIRYTKRVGIMLFAWLFMYTPLLFKEMKSETNVIQQLLFKTPAFLWYLTALIVASILFCWWLPLNTQFCTMGYVIGVTSVVLYVIGTWFGGAYSWASGGGIYYEKIFLTTRNGLFFGFPMLCVGYLAEKYYKKLSQLSVMAGTFISMILLMIEITYVQSRITTGADCSMYFTMPLVIFFLVMVLLKNDRIKINTKLFRNASTAIYVVQYGVISVTKKISLLINVNNNYIWIGCWITVIMSGFLLSYFNKKCRFFKYLI